jgi:hypothetical protein
MKYSINSSGYIVAERDIYSLGGFIPKGSVGCKVANGDQISQDGECWVAKGDISTRPDFRVKDNAYLGEFVVGTSAVYTDGIKELSGDTLVPGPVCFRTNAGAAYSNCDMFVKDSFIGVTMDVLCGSASTAFPFEQGGFNKDVPAGTLFTSASMHTSDPNICRTTANLRLGKETYIYIPTGYNCRVLWGYWNTAGQLAYSGESFAVSQALTKLEHPTYKMAMVHISKANGTAMTPTDLLATGAKILGHVSGSVRSFLNAVSASGTYFFENCRAVWNVSDFSFSTDRHAMFAGYARNCNMVFYNSADLGVFGRFSNIERLDLYRLATPADYSDSKRDTFISAFDCPLLRVTAAFQTAALKSLGNLVLRRCIVPKAIFTDNIHNGNVYEDIDFSYASEFIETKAGNNFDMWSSHKQGEYAAIGAGVAIAGLISRPENLMTGSVVGPDIHTIPLDGNIIEQGTYTAAIGQYYEDAKGHSNFRLMTGKPVSTIGLSVPTVPSGYVIAAAHYLDDGFKFANSASYPSSINTAYPYVVFVFTKDPPSEAIPAAEFIALGLSLRYTNYGKVPEITGSSFIGTGATARGDVKLIGDPYVSRVLDRNLWERKALSGNFTNGWEGAKIERVAGDRMLTLDLQDIGSNGATVSCATGYWIIPYRFTKDGLYLDNPGWVRSHTFGAFEGYVGILIKKSEGQADNGGLITEDDIPLANVKIVQAFKKRRYITNELDRKSPEDILLTPDYWQRATVSTTAPQVGKYYKDLISSSTIWIILKRLLNAGATWTPTLGDSTTYLVASSSWDALTKFKGGGIVDGVALTAFEVRKKDSSTITLAEIESARLIVEFIPSPRIVVPYGFSNITVGGAKVRMYDNAVLSKPMDATVQEGTVILKGDAVARYDFVTVPCFCSNGHSDAIIP